MTAEQLQRWLDEIVDATAQQWALRLTSIATALGAVLAGTAATGETWPTGVVVIGGLAAVSAVRPDSNLSLLLVAVVVVFWATSVDEVATGWLPVAAVCLLGHHTVVALSATIPSGGDVPARVLLRWLARTVVVALATSATWGLVVLFDRRDASGDALLTGAALAVVAAGAVAVRSRSVGRT